MRLHKLPDIDKIEIFTGWIVFLSALATYLLTLEPSASYWDCGEYIMCGTLLETGHPPGNPVWMLTARLFASFAPSVQHIPLMINAMSGVFSALTVLLLYRCIVLLCSMVWGCETKWRLRAVAAGLVGALILCWSDSFWYSSVEAEVYAFATFITALTLWLALKWTPGDGRMIVLIAYIFGLSLGVHLLCLLSLPALVLVMAYKQHPALKTSRAALVVFLSFIPVFFVLYGLMPGALQVAGAFELFFVNTAGLPYNSGLIIYAAAVLLVFASALVVICRKSGAGTFKAIIAATALLISGITSVGGNLMIGLCIAIFSGIIFRFRPRWCSQTLLWSVLMLLIGYSSYTLLIVRGCQNPPHNQETINNIFALQHYISREQYGSNPLFHGPTPYARDMQQRMPDGTVRPYRIKEKPVYVRNTPGVVPTYRYARLTAADSAANRRLIEQSSRTDFYILEKYKTKIVTTPELNVPLTRLHSKNASHITSYGSWAGMTPEQMDSVEVTTMVDAEGTPLPKTGLRLPRPTLMQQLRYFTVYQVGYMYMRYLMWNFLGKQNDILSQGQADAGNLMTGISFLDKMMTGDTSKLPSDMADRNPGHNIYYGLPLLLAILGIAALWDAAQTPSRAALKAIVRPGRSVFWIVFTLFLLTGVAIVIFLNQTPNEPRERDYSFLGSFMAVAIWCGIGVVPLCKIVESLQRHLMHKTNSVAATVFATLLAIAIPLQMLSQTYDDHNRSGRTAAPDFAADYLNLCEKNAILFTDGDNFTFPLWYVRDVEGVRRDVRIANLSYMYSPWYLRQLLIPDHDTPAVPSVFGTAQLAYHALDNVKVIPGGRRDALKVLKETYTEAATDGADYASLRADTLLIAPKSPDADSIAISVKEMTNGSSFANIKQLAMLDIIASNAAQGWKRPIYWTYNSGLNNRLGLKRYITNNGPLAQLTDKPHDEGTFVYNYSRLASLALNGKLKYGGAGTENCAAYFGPEACSIAASLRRTMIQAARTLMRNGDNARALQLALIAEKEISPLMVPFTIYADGAHNAAEGIELGKIYTEIGKKTGREDLIHHGQLLQKQHIDRIIAIKRYVGSLPKHKREYVSRPTLNAYRFRLPDIQ